MKKKFVGKGMFRFRRGTTALLSALLAAGIAAGIIILSVVQAGSGDTWDLGNYITNVSLLDENGTPVLPGDDVFTGKTYTYRISFGERLGANGQWEYKSGAPNNGFLVYQLPGDIRLLADVNNKPIPSPSNPTISIGSYSIDKGTGVVTIKFDNVDTGGNTITENYIDYYANTRLTLEVQTEFQAGDSGGKIYFDFNEKYYIIPGVPTPPPGELKISKSASAKQADETIKHTITITATGGAVNNVQLTDTMSTTHGSVTPGTTYSYKKNGGADTSIVPTVSGSTLTFSFGAMAAGDVIVLEYTVPMVGELDAYAGAGKIKRLDYSVTLNNTATATGTDATNKPLTVTTSSSATLSRKLLAKSGSVVTDIGGDRSIKWTATFGASGYDPVNGYILEDTLVGSGMEFAGGDILSSGVQVLFYPDSGAAVDVTSLALPYFTMTPTGFEFEIPAGGLGAVTDVYRVDIIYYVTAPGGGSLGYGTYTNGLNYGDYSTSATVTIQTPTTPPTIDKESQFHYEPDGTISAIDYTITIVIPAGNQGKQIYMEDYTRLYMRRTGVMDGSLSWQTYGDGGTSFTVLMTGAYINQWGPAPGLTVTLDPPDDLTFFCGYASSTDTRAQWFFFNGASNQIGSAWPYNEQKTLTFTYSLPLDAKTLYADSSYSGFDGSVINPNDKTVGELLELGAVVHNNAKLNFNGTSYYANTENYYPITKKGTVNKDDPSLIDYEVILNNYDRITSSYYAPASYDALFGLGEDAIYTDTFDPQLEYKENSFWVEVQIKASGAPGSHYYYYIGPYSDPGKADQVQVDGSTITVDFRNMTMFETATYQSIAPPPPGLLFSGVASNIVTNNFKELYGGSNWYNQPARYIVHYQLRLKPEALETYGEYDFLNTATVYPTTEAFQKSGGWSSDSTVHWEKKAVQKTMLVEEAAGATAIPVEIIVNPLGIRLRAEGIPSPQITAIDTMTGDLSYNPTSVKIYTQNGGGGWDLMNVTPQPPGELWGVKPISNQQFEMLLLDETPIKITYDAYVTKNSGTAVFTNMIELDGYGEYDFWDQDVYVVQASAVSTDADRGKFDIYKRDADNHEKLLPGAGFALYMALPDNSYYGSDQGSPTPKISFGGKDFFYVMDAADDGGIYRFDSLYLDPYLLDIDNNLIEATYMIVETAAPPDYPPTPLSPDDWKWLFKLKGEPETIGGKAVELLSGFKFIDNERPGVVDVPLNITKTVYGATESKQFTFKVQKVDSDKTTALGPEETFFITDDGFASYLAEGLERPPTGDPAHYYRIWEETPAAPGWHYSPNVYVATVTVPAGTDSPAVFYEQVAGNSNGGTAVNHSNPDNSGVTFINEFGAEPPEASADIECTKAVSDGAPTPWDFAIGLYNWSGTDASTTGVGSRIGAVKTATDSTPTVTFDAASYGLTWTAPGEKYYVVQEESTGGTGGFVKDTTQYLVRITVSSSMTIEKIEFKTRAGNSGAWSGTWTPYGSGEFEIDTAEGSFGSPPNAALEANKITASGVQCVTFTIDSFGGLTVLHDQSVPRTVIPYNNTIPALVIGYLMTNDSKLATGAVYCLDHDVDVYKNGKDGYSLNTTKSSLLSRNKMKQAYWVLQNGFWVMGVPKTAVVNTKRTPQVVWVEPSNAKNRITDVIAPDNLQELKDKFGVVTGGVNDLATLSQEEAYAATQAAVWRFTNNDDDSVAPQNTYSAECRKLFYRMIEAAEEMALVDDSEYEFNPQISVGFDDSLAVTDGAWYGPVKVQVGQLPIAFTEISNIPVTLTPAAGVTISAAKGGAAASGPWYNGETFYINMGSSPTGTLITAQASVSAGSDIFTGWVYWCGGNWGHYPGAINATNGQPIGFIGLYSIPETWDITATGELRCAGGSSAITFTNTYEVAGVPVIICGEKVVKGTGTIPEASFTFTLTQVKNAAGDAWEGPDPAITSETDPVETDGKGTYQFEFPALYFDTEGTYYFKIEETTPGLNWSIEGDAAQFVTVYVKKQNTSGTTSVGYEFDYTNDLYAFIDYFDADGNLAHDPYKWENPNKNHPFGSASYYGVFALGDMSVLSADVEGGGAVKGNFTMTTGAEWNFGFGSPNNYYSQSWPVRPYTPRLLIQGDATLPDLPHSVSGQGTRAFGVGGKVVLSQNSAVYGAQTNKFSDYVYVGSDPAFTYIANSSDTLGHLSGPNWSFTYRHSGNFTREENDILKDFFDDADDGLKALSKSWRDAVTTDKVIVLDVPATPVVPANTLFTLDPTALAPSGTDFSQYDTIVYNFPLSRHSNNIVNIEYVLPTAFEGQLLVNFIRDQTQASLSNPTGRPIGERRIYVRLQGEASPVEQRTAYRYYAERITMNFPETPAGQSIGSITLTSAEEAFGSILAPYSDITLTGSGACGVNGDIVCKDFTINGNSEQHRATKWHNNRGHMTFTNTYEGQEPVVISGEKVVEGDAPDKDFQFELIPWDIDLDTAATGPFSFIMEGDNPLTVETKKQSTGVDRYPFSFVVTGLGEGTWHFAIQESEEGIDDNWVYDLEPKIVTVYVKRDQRTATNVSSTEITYDDLYAFIDYPEHDPMVWEAPSEAKPFGSADYYGVFALGNFEFYGADVEGGIAVKGDLTQTDSAFAVAVGDPNSYWSAGSWPIRPYDPRVLIGGDIVLDDSTAGVILSRGGQIYRADRTTLTGGRTPESFYEFLYEGPDPGHTYVSDKEWTNEADWVADHPGFAVYPKNLSGLHSVDDNIVDRFFGDAEASLQALSTGYAGAATDAKTLVIDVPSTAVKPGNEFFWLMPTWAAGVSDFSGYDTIIYNFPLSYHGYNPLNLIYDFPLNFKGNIVVNFLDDSGIGEITSANTAGSVMWGVKVGGVDQPGITAFKKFSHRITMNFPDDSLEEITLASTSCGSVLAPFSNLTLANCSVNGQIVCRDYTQQGNAEQHCSARAPRGSNRGHLTFTNTYAEEKEPGSLTLKKTVTGTGFDPDKEFTFTVTFSGPEDMDFSGILCDGEPFANPGTVNLKHGQSVTFTNIPAGAAYTITEDDYEDEGYTASGGPTQTGTITGGGDEAVDVTFTNTYAAKKLLADFPIEVRKYLDGIDDVTGRVFTFRLEQVDEWGEPLDESECITVDPPDGLIRIGDMDEGADKEIDTYEEPGSGMKYGTYSFALDKDDLAAGTYYFKVYEVQDKDGYSDPDRWTYDARVYSVTVEVADTGGQLTATATFTLPEEEGPWEYAAFINTYETPSFPFSFTKTDRYGDAFGEGEAVFELYALDCALEHDHDALVTTGTECWALLDTQATGEDGMVAFGMLGSGDYMLVEIKTRPGYQLPLGQWLVHVDSAAQEITITACGELLPPAFYVDEGVFVLTNYPRFILPRAGSFSTLLFTAGGAALTGTAGLLGFRFLNRRKRRRNKLKIL